MNNNRNVVARLHGGLGNQLFQIIAARYLEVSHKNLNLKIYTGDLDKFLTIRLFEIEPLLKNEQVTEYMDSFSRFLFRYKISKLLSLVGLHSISEVKQITSWNGQSLNGYFQDIYNYADYKKLNFLITEIETDLGRMCSNIAERFSALIEGSAAVHLRLTDFLSNTERNNFLKDFRIPYILKAVKWLRDTCNVIKIVVFTDDVLLAKTLFTTEEFIYFKELDSCHCSLLEEFYLLSSFKFLITSNSTFSFWSSVLGNNKTIIFPSIWKHDDPKENAVFLKNIDLHPKMFMRNNCIKII